MGLPVGACWSPGVPVSIWAEGQLSAFHIYPALSPLCSAGPCHSFPCVRPIPEPRWTVLGTQRGISVNSPSRHEQLPRFNLWFLNTDPLSKFMTYFSYSCWKALLFITSGTCSSSKPLWSPSVPACTPPWSTRWVLHWAIMMGVLRVIPPSPPSMTWSYSSLNPQCLHRHTVGPQQIFMKSRWLVQGGHTMPWSVLGSAPSTAAPSSFLSPSSFLTSPSTLPQTGSVHQNSAQTLSLFFF